MGNKVGKKKQKKEDMKDAKNVCVQPKSEESKSASHNVGGEARSNQSGQSLSVMSPARFLALPRNDAVGSLLRAVPLLSKLDDVERSVLGGALLEQKFGDKEAIIRQDDDGNGFYIIKSGECVVTRHEHDSNQSLEIARLRAGDFFGEAALVNDAKRGASVISNGNVTVYFLERSKFNELFGSDRLNVRFAKRAAVSAEKVTSSPNSSGAFRSTSVSPPNAIREKSPQTLTLLTEAVRSNLLFSNLAPEHTSRILAEMWRQEVKSGISLCTQGDLGDNVYVIEDGAFDIFVNQKKVAQKTRGAVFGELALMYNCARAATVTAVCDSIVWQIDRFSFRRIVTDLTQQRFLLYVSFLKRVDLLSPLAEYERKKIAEALEEVQFEKGHRIFKQNDEADTMFIIYSGEVSITKKNDDSEEEVEIQRLRDHDYFGERALLMNEKRAASARVVSNQCSLIKIDRNAFSLLLGPLEEIMRKKVANYEKDEKAQHQRSSTPSNAAQAKSASPSTLRNVKYTDLKFVATLGRGSFGHVSLVEEAGTGQVYALKAVSKAQIVQTGQQGHVMSEKAAMLTFNHPFCIKLFSTYKDANRLFFLLEPVLGGELFAILRERTLFDEDTARFYAASVILVFEYMHSHGFVYRDLKPENLLVDEEGFLKVTDFGFAKDIGEEKTWTLCGTPDYLAPEIVKGAGHTKSVDWWTLGIFIYEMLASYPPFYDEDPMRTYQKIVDANVHYPSHFSRAAQNLISKLLHPKPHKRMGASKYGALEIKKHPWFKDFDWDALYARKMKVPIVPKPKKNKKDSTNYDKNQDQSSVEPYVDDGSNWDADF